MEKCWIGIDNGVSGTIGVISTDCDPEFFKTPAITVQDYTGKKKNVTRLDTLKFRDFLLEKKKKYGSALEICCERPMVNPALFKATESALRCFEAMWTVIDLLALPVYFIPSTDWQKKLLPEGTKGADALKKASLDIGNRLYPQFRDVKHPDRDGLLIALWMAKYNSIK